MSIERCIEKLFTDAHPNQKQTLKYHFEELRDKLNSVDRATDTADPLDIDLYEVELTQSIENFKDSFNETLSEEVKDIDINDAQELFNAFILAYQKRGKISYNIQSIN